MGFFQSFVDFLNRGGPAMYALLLLSNDSVGIVLERLYFFSKQHSDPSALLKEIGDRVNAGIVAAKWRRHDHSQGRALRLHYSRYIVSAVDASRDARTFSDT